MRYLLIAVLLVAVVGMCGCQGSNLSSGNSDGGAERWKVTTTYGAEYCGNIKLWDTTWVWQDEGTVTVDTGNSRIVLPRTSVAKYEKVSGNEAMEKSL